MGDEPRSEIRPTFDVFSVGKVIWAMIAGQPRVPLCYIHEEHSELTKLFPDNGAMLWANELLNKCIVEKESQMKIQDAAALLKEIDVIIEAQLAAPPLRIKGTEWRTLRAFIDAVPSHLIMRSGELRTADGS